MKRTWLYDKDKFPDSPALIIKHNNELYVTFPHYTSYKYNIGKSNLISVESYIRYAKEKANENYVVVKKYYI